MAQNQNDQRNQQAGSKSTQQPKDGKNKETNPDNPTANKGTQESSQSGNQYRSGSQQGSQSGSQRKDSSSPQGKTNTDMEDDEREETSGKRRTGDAGSEREERRTGNQNKRNR